MEIAKKALNQIGWFIPPYITMGLLDKIVSSTLQPGVTFKQSDLERHLSTLYNADHLASMVCERYCRVPYVSDYKEIISESIEAHFSGLRHISVAGLMPVVEGVGRRIAKDKGVESRHIKDTFLNLAKHYKQIVESKQLGAVEEVLCMLDSFINYTKDNFYISSHKYPQEDNTNRNGILHGAYSDGDYGEPISFYKSIAAVDFLCFIASIDAPISWFAPNFTKEAQQLAGYYRMCVKINQSKPIPSAKEVTRYDK